MNDLKMNDLRHTFCCYGRYFLMCLIYGIGYNLLLMIPMGLLNLGAQFFGEIGSLIYYLVFAIANILIGILVIQKALKPVFFKPYKHFKLNPKIEKITFLFAAKFYMIVYALFFVALFSIMATEIFVSGTDISSLIDRYNSDQAILLATLKILPFLCCFELCILRFYINKYAVIIDTSSPSNSK